MSRTFAERSPGCRCLALLAHAFWLAPSLAVGPLPNQAVSSNDSLRHGWHWGFAAQHASYYNMRPWGLAAEGAFEADVAIGAVRGTLSFGFQPAYFHDMGRWSELPYNIGHLKQLNLRTPAGTAPSMVIGNQRVYAGDIFLIGRGNVPFNLSGFLSLSPAGEVVAEYEEYTVKSMRASMWGLTLPMRWLFGKGHGRGVRPFVELGLGFDLIRTAAEYEVLTNKVTYNYLPNEIRSSTARSISTEPMKGEAWEHLLFTRAHLGAGASYRRFSLGFRAQRTVAKELTFRGASYQRVRSNILAIPFLGGAGDDVEVAREVQSNGIAIYGRSGMAKQESAEGARSSEGLYGLSRFWDRTTWLLSLTYWLR